LPTTRSHIRAHFSALENNCHTPRRPRNGEREYRGEKIEQERKRGREKKTGYEAELAKKKKKKNRGLDL
jgi:hypothetical protein